MTELIIYEKPTCSTCRVAVSLVDESGRAFRRVRYHEERLDEAALRKLVTKLGMRPHAIVRTKETLFKEQGRALETLTEDEVFGLLAAHPELLERPILEYGDRAVLGRPMENVVEFLKSLE